MSKMKLIMESWRDFGVDEAEINPALTKNPLPTVVSRLQGKDGEFISSLLHGLEDGEEREDAIPISETTPACIQLRPTQAEVVFSKSIPFALQRPKTFMEYFTSNGPFEVGPPNNNAIITLNNEYVLDGHHRWSSLYCVNPYAKMHAFNLNAKDLPALDSLKAAQASIFAYAKDVPSNKGGGTNLFGISEEDLKKGVWNSFNEDAEGQGPVERANQYIELGLMKDSKGSVKEAIESGRDEERVKAVVNRLLGIYTRNIVTMKSNNPPESGATSREPMPQTDAPSGSNVKAGGAIPKALQPLAKGQIDIRAPFRSQRRAAESKERSGKLIINIKK